MPAPQSGTARPSRAPLAAVVALALAACGGGASAQPSPTPEPTEEPTPTPFDVAAAFLEIVTDPEFSARMDVDGTMEMGLTGELSGTISGSGDNSHAELTISFGDTSQNTETISVDGRTYTRSGTGPWLEEEPEDAAGEDSLAEFLRTLESLEDLGVVTKNGRELHHLSAGDTPIPPGALGLDASEYTDPEVFIELYAEDDGTPAIFAIEGTWDQDIGGQTFTVEFLMDLTISDVGSTITISAPDEVWTAHESDLGYRVGVPPDFEVISRSGYDDFSYRDDVWFQVGTWSEGAGMTNDAFLQFIIEDSFEYWGDPVETVPTTLAGIPAYLTSYTYEYEDGTPAVVLDVSAVNDDLGWELTLYTLPEEAEADGALFDQFLSTFRFAD